MVELNSFTYTRSILCTFVFTIIILLFDLVYFTGYEQSEWSFHPVSSIYSFLAVSWYKFSFFSLSPYDRDWRDDNGTRNKHSVNNTARIVCGTVCVIVWCLSHLPAAAACGWFAAVGRAGRRYWSIVAAASTAADGVQQQMLAVSCLRPRDLAEHRLVSVTVAFMQRERKNGKWYKLNYGFLVFHVM